MRFPYVPSATPDGTYFCFTIQISGILIRSKYEYRQFQLFLTQNHGDFHYQKGTMTRRFTLTMLAVFAAVLSAVAQIMTPVKWAGDMKMTGDDKGEIILTATIDAGWHLYSWDFAANANA